MVSANTYTPVVTPAMISPANSSHERGMRFNSSAVKNLDMIAETANKLVTKLTVISSA